MAIDQHTPRPKATAPNPPVLLDATSDSSADYATVDKLEYHRTIPSLRDEVVVSHRERRITIHSRTADGNWISRIAIADGRVMVQCVGAELVTDEVDRASTIGAYAHPGGSRRCA